MLEVFCLKHTILSLVNIPKMLEYSFNQLARITAAMWSILKHHRQIDCFTFGSFLLTERKEGED